MSWRKTVAKIGVQIAVEILKTKYRPVGMVIEEVKEIADGLHKNKAGSEDRSGGNSSTSPHATSNSGHSFDDY